MDLELPPIVIQLPVRLQRHQSRAASAPPVEVFPPVCQADLDEIPVVPQGSIPYRVLPADRLYLFRVVAGVVQARMALIEVV